MKNLDMMNAFDIRSLNIRPVITHDESVKELDNPAIREIAEDVANSIAYSLTGVTADEQVEVRPGTMEADFKLALAGMKQIPKRAKLVENGKVSATKLLSLPESGLEQAFGRFGKIPAKAFVLQGFDRAAEGLAPLKLRTEDFGIRIPKLQVSVNTLQGTNDGLFR